MKQRRSKSPNEGTVGYRYGDGNPVCGRKFCRSCGRWRLVIDFPIWGRTERGTPIGFRPDCHACLRTYNAEYRQRTLARRRALEREHHRVRRRMQGIKPRYEDDRGYRVAVVLNGRPTSRKTLPGPLEPYQALTASHASRRGTRVDPTSFFSWLDRWKAENPHASIERTCELAGFNIRRFNEARRAGHIHLDKVEAFLELVNGPQAWELGYE